MAGKELKNYSIVLKQLQEKIRVAKFNAILAVNAELIKIYWEIGNVIAEQEKVGGWGSKIIDNLARDLKIEFPDMSGFSKRNLIYMRDFSLAYPILQQAVAKTQNTEIQEITFLQPVVAKIPWTHHTLILDKVKTEKERLFYIEKTVENKWTKNVLTLQLNNQLHLRQGNAITNFKDTLPMVNSELANEHFKSKYIFDFVSLSEEAKERDLENALIAQLKKFMLELGRGFAYVGNQFCLQVDNDEFFTDLLFYNTRLHCYVVFELKIGAFKPEYAGKLNFYLSAMDEQVKLPEDKPTIGILLCSTPNKTVVEYALRGINKPMGVADFEREIILPENLKTELPTIDELTFVIEHEVQEIENTKKTLDTKLDKLKNIIGNLKSEEAVKKDNKYIKEIYYKFLVPLVENVTGVLEKEIYSLFDSTGLVVFYNNGPGIDCHSNPDFDVRILRGDVIDKIMIEFQFNGFKKAGTNAFNCHQNIYIEFLEYKYEIKTDAFTATYPTKLYSQIPNKEEIDEISEMLLNKIVDEISEKVLKLETNKESFL